MMVRFLKFFFAFLASCLLTLQGFSQNLTGIWRGYFITEGAEQYKFELQIEQSPKKAKKNFRKRTIMEREINY